MVALPQNKLQWTSLTWTLHQNGAKVVPRPLSDTLTSPVAVYLFHNSANLVITNVTFERMSGSEGRERRAYISSASTGGDPGEGGQTAVKNVDISRPKEGRAGACREPPPATNPS